MQFYGHHNALKMRILHTRPILATARKPLRMIVAMLHDRRPCIDPGSDNGKQLVDRDASHRLRKLEELGYLDSIRSGGEPRAARVRGYLFPPPAVAPCRFGHRSGIPWQADDPAAGEQTANNRGNLGP